MGSMALRYQTPYLRECEKCGKRVHGLYRVQIGPATYNLCSNQCVGAAQQNYNDKKEAGILDENDEVQIVE